jgi:subtilisin family serine protease
LHNTGQTSGTPDADIDAPEAWDLHTSGEDIVVAVIDTGIDYTHPDLAANMWVNPGEIPGNGIDDDEPIIRKLSLKNTCALQFGYGIIAVKVL